MSKGPTPAALVKEAKKEAFLAEFARTGLIVHSAIKAGTSPGTVKSWLRADPDFHERYQEAIESNLDSIEHEALRRAVWGYEEPVIHQGQFVPIMTYSRDENGELILGEDGKPKREPVLNPDGTPKIATVTKYSDSLMAKVLEAKVKKYQRASKIELTGADGGPVELATSKIEQARRIAFALKQGLLAAKQAEDNSDLV